MLGLERSARAAGSEPELAFVMVNETRKLNGARQTLLLQRDRRGKLALTAASSVDAIDADAPFSRWIERLVAGLAADKGLQEAHDFALPAYCEPGDAENETYPFRNLLCIPLLDRAGSAFACLVCAREAPWLSTDTVISKWVAEAYAHAALALAGGGRAVTTRRLAIRSWHCAIGAVGVLILAALPVSMSALAPVEVIAMNPYVIAAPFEGVIDEVLVQPSAQVAGGDVLFRFVDITLRNKFDAAEKTAQVAEAKYRRSAQAAFADTQARHELTIAAAEMGQARAERDYAREMLDKGVVKAPMAGIAVFANKDDWKGRPVSTGEKVMLIAKPGETALRIDLPVKDAIRPFPTLLVNRGATVIERYTRVSDKALLYQYTVVDPATYTAPWLAEYALARAERPLYEFACHEGNYSLPNILAGARELDRQRAAARR